MTEDAPEFIEGKIHLDDRGYVEFFNDLDLSPFVRFYLIQNSSSNFVRAWHGHRYEAKAFICLKGEFKVSAVEVKDFSNPDPSVKPYEFYLGEKKPGVLIVPPGFANGTMNFARDSKLMVFSSSSLQISLSDDYRFDWNTWNVWDSEFR